MPPSNHRIRAVAEVTAAAAALAACVATSPAPSGPGEPDSLTTGGDDPQVQTADVVLHNGLDATAVVRVRHLSPAVDLECTALRADPGALLTEALLGPTQTWTIASGDNLGIDPTQGRPCAVVRLDGDGVSPRWLLWEPGVRPQVTFEPGVPPEGPRVVRLRPGGSGAVPEGSDELVFTPDDPPRGTEACAPVGDGQRVEWGEPVPAGGVLRSASWGPDGCAAVVLSAEDDDEPRPWFVCIPEAAWPFAVGDELQVQPLFGSGTEAVELVSRDGDDVAARLQVSRSAEASTLAGLRVVYGADEGCGYDVEPGCGTVTRVGWVDVLWAPDQALRLHPGESAEGIVLEDDGLETRVELIVAQERVALDPECALGPDVLGPDLALVVTQEAEQ